MSLKLLQLLLSLRDLYLDAAAGAVIVVVLVGVASVIVFKYRKLRLLLVKFLGPIKRLLLLLRLKLCFPLLLK